MAKTKQINPPAKKRVFLTCNVCGLRWKYEIDESERDVECIKCDNMIDVAICCDKSEEDEQTI